MTKCRQSSKQTPTPIKEPNPAQASSARSPDSSQTLAVTCNPVKYPEGHPDCRLLDLPPELRRTIYSAAISDGGNSLTLLQTCRLIHMESTMLLHQRPITFSSQAKLFSWIAETQSEDLKRVKNIKLHLTDIDLSSLFDPRPFSDKRNGKSSSCWYLYSAELLRLEQALQALAGLVELTVIPPEKSTSLMRGVYLSFMELIPRRCLRLRVLSVLDQETLLQKVPRLMKVPKVVFLDAQDLKGCSVPIVKSELRERAAKIKIESEW